VLSTTDANKQSSWEATTVGFSLISLVFSILEITKYISETLTPFFLLCSQVVKLTLFLAVLGLDVTEFIARVDGPYTTIGLAIDCAQM
jgi:hypothetical protein